MFACPIHFHFANRFYFRNIFDKIGEIINFYQTTTSPTINLALSYADGWLKIAVCVFSMFMCNK